jgi:hypothetical protein
MKRFYKVLAVALALILVIGVVPASAASSDLSLTKTKKTIFVDGCRGTTAAGKEAKYYSYAGIKKLVKNFDSKTMDIKLDSSDPSVVSTDDKKDRVNAVAPGKAAVTVNVFKKKSSELLFSKSIVVTVKKNATAKTLLVSGIKDGDKFKVKDSVTVSLTRKSGSDTDLRRLIASGDGVTISEAGTRKFKVTFTKAGTYTLTAEAYMSEKYDGATAFKSFAVTVADDTKEEEKKDDKKEEEKKAGKLEAVQIAADAFKLTGSSITSAYTKDSVKMYYLIANTRVDFHGEVKSVSVTDNTATVTMFSNLEQDQTYYVVFGEEEASFKTIKVDANDPVKSIKSIVLKTHTATINESVDIEFIYYDATGVDITNIKDLKSLADSRVELTVTAGDTNGYVDTASRTINIYEKGKAVTIKYSLTTDYEPVNYTPITVSGTGNIVGVEKVLPVVSSSIWTLSNDGDANYLKKTDKTNSTICVGDSGYVLEVLYLYSDGTVKTPKELGAVATSVNESVLMIGGTGASGGDLLIPNQTGETYIKYKVGDQELPGIRITVQAERKASSIVATVDKQKLNINAGVNDSIEIDAIVKDQYGVEMKNEPLFITQKDASMKDVTVSFGSFLNGKLIVMGTDCTIIGTNPVYNVVADVSNGNGLTRTVSFTVRDIPFDSSKLTTYNATLEVEGDLNIDTGLVNGKQNDKETYAYVSFSSDGFCLSENVGYIRDKAPTTALKASDFSKTAGAQIVYMTIQFQPEGGSETYITSGVNIEAEDNGFFITFDPVSAGKKLAKGRYTLKAYLITLGETSSVINKQITPVRVITVKDNALVGSYVQKKETLNISGPVNNSNIAEFFDFYLEGEKLDPSQITSVDFSGGADGKTAFITSVTFTLTNDPYGPFQQTIKVGKLIKFSA